MAMMRLGPTYSTEQACSECGRIMNRLGGVCAVCGTIGRLMEAAKEYKEAAVIRAFLRQQMKKLT